MNEMKKKAILVENNMGEFPEFLRNRFESLFIPFQNRPLIDWHLDELSKLGYESVSIFTNNFKLSSEQYVNGGIPWGIDAKFIYYGQNRKMVLKLISESDRYSRGDIYFMNDLSMNGKLQNPGLLDSLENFREFHMNTDHTNPTKISREAAEGVFSGIRSSFSFESNGGEQHIGNYTSLAKNVQLTGVNWIGDYSVIDDSVILKNTVVFPGTYIGRNLAFENCIIYKNSIIDFISGKEVFLEDPLLLSGTKNIFGEIPPKTKRKNNHIEFILTK